MKLENISKLYIVCISDDGRLTLYVSSLSSDIYLVLMKVGTKRKSYLYIAILLMVNNKNTWNKWEVLGLFK